MRNLSNRPQLLNLPFSLYTVSDLHLEHFRTEDKKKLAESAASCIPDTEVLVLAGDIGWPGTEAWTSFLSICAAKHKLVVYVLGNHELWSKKDCTGRTWTPEEIEFRCAQLNIVVLNNSSIKYKNVTFIGSTLWTPLLSVEGVPLTQSQVSDINDFKNISGFNSVKDWRRRFQKSMESLLTELEFLKNKKQETGQDVPCIIVTHHAPSFQCISSVFHGDIINGCYASNVLESVFDLSFVKAWIFGHTHKTMRRAVGKRLDTLLIGHAAREENYKYMLKKESTHDLGMVSKG